MEYGVIYKCIDCSQRYFFRSHHDEILESPCPVCESSSVTIHSDGTENITARKTAGDIYPRVSRYNGR